jgi:hypothetical protein
MPSSVLPQPAPPQTSVGRPAGNPPPVISSNPLMPVGHLEIDYVLPPRRLVHVVQAIFLPESKKRLFPECDSARGQPINLLEHGKRIAAIFSQDEHLWRCRSPWRVSFSGRDCQVHAARPYERRRHMPRGHAECKPLRENDLTPIPPPCSVATSARLADTASPPVRR